MSKWETVFSSKDLHRAEIVKAVLMDKGLSPVIVDKQDRSYKLGLFEVMVIQSEVLQAANIVNNDIQFE